MTVENVAYRHLRCNYDMKYFDAMGNIRRLQRYTQEQQLIDDLRYTYCGNQVQNITDYAGSADLYAVKEYQDRNTTDSVEQFYDPNGNLIIDLDRGITHIAYNLLNLPDTICFANGNQIINRYDAAGNKQETQTITLQDTKFSPTPLNGMIFDISQADTCIIRYSGNREFMYTPSRQRDSLLLQKSIIHNAEGYTQYTYTGASDSPKPMQYYFHKDHLGNVCAVWNAMTSEVVQRTNYYPSGVPMAQSTGQSVQPLKYNAHEYIEAYGYDVYDYGFRGYYATIGRFTSIDPLCERTPWQSPYAYANNNWINQIDILGLAGSDAYTTQDPAKISKLLDFLADGGSLNSFDFDEEGWTEGVDVNWWLDEGILLLTDKSGNNNYIMYSHGAGYLSEITVNANNQYKISQIHSDAVNVEVDALSLFFTLLEKQSSVFRELKYSRMFTFMSALQLYDDVNHFRSEPNARDGLNIIKDALSIKSNPYILMAVLTIDIDLWLFDVVSNQIVQLDNQLNDMNYWGDIYLNGY